MTLFEKLKYYERAPGWFGVRKVDGAWWTTDGHILLRIDEPAGAEEFGKATTESIKRVLDNAVKGLPDAVPVQLGALGKDGPHGTVRTIITTEGEHYIQEQYFRLMRGDLSWLGGGFNGPHHSLVGTEHGVLVALAKGMRDSDVAQCWKPITEGYDPAAEAEYYRDLALYPDEEDED